MNLFIDFYFDRGMRWNLKNVPANKGPDNHLKIRSRWVDAGFISQEKIYYWPDRIRFSRSNQEADLAYNAKKISLRDMIR
jgi:hypothetical protein